MQDQKLEGRKENFQKSNKNIVEARQNFKLSLRKEKIDEFILRRREKILEKGEEKSQLEINSEKLNLSSEILNKNYTSIDEFISFVKDLLHSNELDKIKYAILLIRKQLSLERNPPIIELANNGFLGMFLTLMDANINDHSIIYEIIWCFTNFTAGLSGPEICNFFLSPKAFRIFEKIFNSGVSDLISNLIWLLTHIVADNASGRDEICNSNLFLKLIEMLESEKVSKNVLKNGLWLISNVSKTSCDISDFDTFKRILNILCIYVKCEEFELFIDCLWSLSNFSNSSKQGVLRYMMDMGIVPVLFKINSINNPTLIELPLRILGNLLTGDDIMIDHLISVGVIPILAKHLRSDYIQIRREATWALSNIASGTKGEIATLVDSGYLPQVFELVKDSSTDVVREAVWVMSNCLTGSDFELCVKLVKIGVVDPIIYTIGNHLEPSILVIALEGLKNLFTQGNLIKEFSNNNENPFVTIFINKGAIEYLEKLQSHNNAEVYESVISILDKFFNVVEHRN